MYIKHKRCNHHYLKKKNLNMKNRFVFNTEIITTKYVIVYTFRLTRACSVCVYRKIGICR